MAEEIRVRIAPSPTGRFHIGTARTALFNYLFAKKFNGKFIVRVEDTDKERHDEDSLKDILEGLLWLGMSWDEGPEVGGPYGPYFQQERLGLYEPFVAQLIDKKLAYRCYCTQEELSAEREAQQGKNAAPKYSGHCRNLTATEIDQYEQAGRPSAVRFIVEPQVVSFDDLIKGKVEFDASLFGDFVIQRSDGTPLFVLSNVIDDNLMKISHVLRGEDHLVNTAKQILLAEALGFLSPQFGHFPMILNKDRSKMSKRKNPVSISDDYKAKGFLPDALVNFIALLGWNSGTEREIFSMQELIDEFEINRVGTSPSIFDTEKLLWMNGYYIRQKSIGEVAEAGRVFITNDELQKAVTAKPDFFLNAIALVHDRLKLLSEIEDQIEYFFISPKYEPSLLIAKKSNEANTLAALKSAVKVVSELKTMGLDEVEPALRGAAEDLKIKDGELLWAVRVALSGRDASPGAFELLGVIGKEESVNRIKSAIKKLSTP
ncbi:MAG: glutamate--tRNA ligase [Candidatus Berkelbacteria bacterium]|nr:glutamate--tRNA ligase [Candidatus Berkelbacteria bacterium]